MPTSLTLAQARRAALAAQGFGVARPQGPVTARHVQRVIDRVAQFQIDSVNVAVRAHYMPLFSRLGGYDPGLLDRAAGQAPRRLFEYWAHAACLVDVRLEPAFRRAMRIRAERERPSVDAILAAKPDFLDRVLTDVASSGPLTPRQIENVEERRRDHWGWNWSEAKYLLEYLFDSGQVSVAGRNSAFERLYDLPERVLPQAVRDQVTPSDEQSLDLLIERAAAALGVADLKALSSYFFLRTVDTRGALERLEGRGIVEPVRVQGLKQPFWKHAEARVPRRIEGQALVCPFDTLVHERVRLEQLFGVNYRIEIYTPEAKRQYGYYVYLFVMDDQIVARVDLKADRGAGVLLVKSAWIEDAALVRSSEVATRLTAELHLMAAWLGLDRVQLEPRGSLAGALGRVLRAQ